MEAEKSAGKRSRTKYDAAFRIEAARRVTQDGQATTRVKQALGSLGTHGAHPSRPPRGQPSSGVGKLALASSVGSRGDGTRYFKKSADHVFTTDGPIKRVTFSVLYAPSWPVRQQCCLLGVSASGYYAWQKRVSIAAISPDAAIA